MFKKIYDYCKNDIPRGIKNLITWFPVVWKDRQWDHQFIYVVLRHKLHLAEQYIRHHGIHVNNIRDANQIKMCINLLDRLIKDEYHEIAFKRHEEKWGLPKFIWNDANSDEKMYELIIKYPNVKTDKDKKSQNKDFGFASSRETELREQDLDLLFGYMRKHIQGWWE